MEAQAAPFHPDPDPDQPGRGDRVRGIVNINPDGSTTPTAYPTATNGPSVVTFTLTAAPAAHALGGELHHHSLIASQPGLDPTRQRDGQRSLYTDRCGSLA